MREQQSLSFLTDVMNLEDPGRSSNSSGKIFILLDTVMSLRHLQSQKALLPIEATSSGMVTEERTLHPYRVYEPILVIPFSKTTVFNESVLEYQGARL